ncbi:MAG TPA: sigma-70 family RNA polymerase sigma factor [Thermoanaerobaculia bacterium]|nr:sigma-70 family RNA polymerase sigma factor [Thermoanaerobaculia bacterium]
MTKQAAFEAPRSDRNPAIGMGLLPASRTAAPDQAYLEHAMVMRRVAIRKFRVPPGDAEALVHDVFINYIASTRSVRADLRAYLIGAICNACRNYWRSRGSEERVFDDEGPAVAEVLSDRDLFEGVARNLMVASALARLNPRCREALKRYYLDGDDTRSVAEALATSEGNVNYLMHVCRKKARAIFERISRVP